MKKVKLIFLGFILAIISVGTLVACNGDKTLANAFDALEITFDGNDTATTVTKNLGLKTSDGDVVITWASNRVEIISNAGVVTRQTFDESVILTATLSYNNDVMEKPFALYVLAKLVNPVDALKEHYSYSIGKPGWEITSKLDLIDEINGFPVTWESSKPAIISSVTGVVTKPSYTEADGQGGIGVQLTATVNGQSVIFQLFVLQEAPTVTEIINEGLRLATITSVSQEFQTTDFDAIDEVTAFPGTEYERKLSVSWITSDDTVMEANGQLVYFGGTENKSVALTAEISYSGTTLTRDVNFLCKPVDLSTDDITVLVNTANITTPAVFGLLMNVSYVGKMAGSNLGYYVADAYNNTLYVYGAVPAIMVEQGGRYNIAGTVAQYYNSFQLATPSARRIGDGEHTITPTEMTLAQFVAMTRPGATISEGVLHNVHHGFYKITDVMAYVDTTKANNYQTYLVPQDHTGVTNSSNSIMIYYQSEMNDIMALNGTKIDSIEVFLNGYRTNNDCWNVDYIQGCELVVAALTDAEKVAAAKSSIANIFKNVYYENQTITLPVAHEFGATISWSSDKTGIISNVGAVVVPATQETVVMTATITSNGASDTAVFNVLVGPLAVTPLSSVGGLANNTIISVVGVVTGISGNGTFTFSDGTNHIAIYVGNNTALVVGNTYKLIGTKGVYNDIIQVSIINNLAGEREILQITDSGSLISLPAVADINGEAAWDAAMMANYKAQVISFSGIISNLVIAAAPNRTVTFTVTSGTRSLNIRWDYRILVDADILDHFLTLSDGDYVEMIGAVSWYSGNAQIGVWDASQVVVVNLTDAQKVDLVKAELVTLLEGQTNLDDYTLPTTSPIYGGTITWVADVPSALVDGKLVGTAPGAVVLTATITIGIASDTQVINVTVGVSVGTTVNAAYPAVAGTTTNMVDGNNAASLGLDPAIFNVVSNKNGHTTHIGLNAAGQIRLYATGGNGNILEVSIVAGYEITEIVFTFGDGSGSGHTANLTLGTDAPTALTAAQVIKTAHTSSSLAVTSFKFHNSAPGTAQIWITNIAITYQAV